MLRVVVALVLLVTASLGVRERRVERALDDAARVNLVDFGVRLHVVRKAPADGEELIPGKPRMRLVDTIDLGGMVRIRDGGAEYTGPSLDPRPWFASEQQARLILHGNDLPLWMLIEGSEGAGKSTLLAMWHWARVAEHVGERVEGGLTAPTYARLGHVRKAIEDLWDPSWYRWHERAQIYRTVVGPRLQLVSAVKRSEAGGSPIQGANWSWHGGDELQDHFEREADIEARGRSAKGGRYKRLNTATPKDLTSYRDFRAACASSKPDPVTGEVAWGVERMLGPDSPFIPDAHWNRLRSAGTMTEREYRRRVLAMDVGPERQVYFNWRRVFDGGAPANLRAIPDGARDVTAEVLAPWLANAAVLVGHDPGLRQNVSVLLKAFTLPGQRRGDDRPRWFVVDEITSAESTNHAHAQQVLARLRSQWNCHVPGRDGRVAPDAPVALVRIDPHTRGAGEDHPGADVATIWRALGMVARAAAYQATASAVSPAVIKRRQRIDMINTLLAATDSVGEVRRLFVATRSGFMWPESERDGKPAAESLVKAFETMEFNAAGQAERDKKDADDLSHWPAALGYALWNVEAPRLGWAAEAPRAGSTREARA